MAFSQQGSKLFVMIGFVPLPATQLWIRAVRTAAATARHTRDAGQILQEKENPTRGKARPAGRPSSGTETSRTAALTCHSTSELLPFPSKSRRRNDGDERCTAIGAFGTNKRKHKWNCSVTASTEACSILCTREEASRRRSGV